MPPVHHNPVNFASALARKTEGAAAGEIAATVTAALGAIETSLHPIIGRGGVVAMFRRSLLLVASAYPWLTSGDDVRNELDLAALQALLAAQGAEDAAKAGGALLQAFCDLLASLIGKSLSERLLRNVWADLNSDNQDHNT